MNSTFIRNEFVQDPVNIALPYDEYNVLYNYKYYAYGAGGIYSTLNDLYKWDQALYSDQIISQCDLTISVHRIYWRQNNYGYTGG